MNAEVDDDAVLDKIIEAWADVDADALIEELRRAREEGSRPMDWHGFSL